MSFRYTGFADEASPQLAEQIALLQQAGWTAIELRGVNGGHVGDLSDNDWGQTLAALRQNQITVIGFGGQIANWARPIAGDFQRDLDELERCAPRMKEAGTRLIRISWISIEPHLVAAVHEGKQARGEQAKDIWLDYARRIERLANAV